MTGGASGHRTPAASMEKRMLNDGLKGIPLQLISKSVRDLSEFDRIANSVIIKFGSQQTVVA